MSDNTEVISCPFCYPHDTGWIDIDERTFNCTHCGTQMPLDNFVREVAEIKADWMHMFDDVIAKAGQY